MRGGVAEFVRSSLSGPEQLLGSPFDFLTKRAKEVSGVNCQASCQLMENVHYLKSKINADQTTRLLFPCLRSNAEKEVGELLKDPHRLNVALTRAKYKLLMIGDLSTLSTDSMFGRLEGWLREKDWVLDLCDEDLD